MPKNTGEKVSRPPFRCTKTRYRELKNASYDRDLVSKDGKGRGTFQAIAEEALELFLAIPLERFKKGDVKRLKEYAAFLAVADKKAIALVENLIKGGKDVPGSEQGQGQEPTHQQNQA